MRAISVSTDDLSTERLIAQFEITTSTEFDRVRRRDWTSAKRC